MAERAAGRRGFLPDYFDGLQLKETKERYLEKLKDVAGQDPYEIPRNQWIDVVDSWPDAGLHPCGNGSPVFFESIHSRSIDEL